VSEVVGDKPGTSYARQFADVPKRPNTAASFISSMRTKTFLTGWTGTAESRKEHTIVECRALAALRDALLPRLLSGELRVNMAEKLVEDVAGG
jgi:hypothetical protein